MLYLYFNSEVGPCRTEKDAVTCIKNSLSSYFELEDEFTRICQLKDTFLSFPVCIENGKQLSIKSFVGKLDGKDALRLEIFIEKFSKGTIVYPNDELEVVIAELDAPSVLFGYAYENKSAVFSFASDDFWKRDFIPLKDLNDCIPNIWGQKDLSAIREWINTQKSESLPYFERIQKEFNIEFCSSDINANSFTTYEWRKIYDVFKRANEYNFRETTNFIQKWDSLPIRYIRYGNHSNFTLRVFFIALEKQIKIGGIYHKNTDNTIKEKSIAEKSYNIFKNKGFCK